jgi:hypothetical protein
LQQYSSDEHIAAPHLVYVLTVRHLFLAHIDIGQLVIYLVLGISIQAGIGQSIFMLQ